MSESGSALPAQRGFFGHPRGLATLFGTEMWERFSYYGMKAILLFYMYGRLDEGGLGIEATTAAALVAAYGASIYLSAIAGGWVADRVLGARKSVLVGGVLIMVGHICLALPAGRPALYASMVFIVLGTGLLKPNISNAVGDLYPEQDRRRDAGYSIFYMGTSVGAVIAPYAIGTLGQQVNYHAGFSLAAVGMAIGLVQYVRGWRHLGDVGARPTHPLRKDPHDRRTLIVIGVVAGVVGLLLVVLGLLGWVTPTRIVALISVVSVGVPIAYFVMMFRSRLVSRGERSGLLAYIPLFIAAAFFWLIQEQGASVLAQYADQRTRLDQWGFAIPSSWFQSVGSAVLIILTPFFAMMWTRLGDRLSTPRKFTIGLGFAGVSFLWLVIPATTGSGDGLSSPLWLVGSFALVTIGEMFLSPIGLSATNRLAPKAFRNQTMGLWLAASAFGQGVSAQVVQFYTPETEASYFLGIGIAALILVLGLIMITPFVKRNIRRSEQPATEPATEGDTP
ncbi:MAG: peptide MFS transporter [Propionibacteriaceae bacterium]